jgi:hypothetical protein
MNKLNFWVKWMPSRFQMWYWTFPNGQMIESYIAIALTIFLVWIVWKVI